MKRIFLLLFILSISKGFSQTYSFVLSYSAQGSFCSIGAHGGYIKADNMSIFDNVTYGSSYPTNFNNRAFTLKTKYTSFEFMLNDGCGSNCNDKQTYSLMNLIKARYVTLWGCNATQRFAIDNFIPNVSIKNVDSASPNQICAGYELGLAAFATELVPNAPDFPAEVYHWIYSLDNKQTWIEVPKYIDGKETNDRPTTNFSIQQLLGDNHVNYFNKTIYFNLAYGNTTALAIKYSPCAPVAENVVYTPPQCNDDNIQKIDVFFDRDFVSGEDFSTIYVLNADPLKGTIHFQNYNITSLVLDPETNKYKYTFLNPGKLEPGNFYRVKYQGRKDGNNTGSLSSTGDPFQYINPEKLSFAVTDRQRPSCFGGNDGFIEVTITSGTSPFHFYKNSTEITPEVSNGKYYIRNLSEGNYDIVVTDSSGCIDKNAND